jgi:hypothetical protein
MPDEGPAVLPHDEAPAGLLDDGAAAGLNPLASLGTELIDIANIGHAGLLLLKALRLSLLATPRQRPAGRNLCGLLTGCGLPALLACWRLRHLIRRDSPYALRSLALRRLALLLGLALLRRHSLPLLLDVLRELLWLRALAQVFWLSVRRLNLLLRLLLLLWGNPLPLLGR